MRRGASFAKDHSHVSFRGIRSSTAGPWRAGVISVDREIVKYRPGSPLQGSGIVSNKICNPQVDSGLVKNLAMEKNIELETWSPLKRGQE